MFDDIKKLIKIFEDTDLKSIEVETKDLKIKLEKDSKQIIVSNENIQTSTSYQDLKKASLESNNTIKSPLVGTFYLKPNPKSKPFIEIGKKVKKGETLFIIEAMKVMNEIKADNDMTILDILVKDGEAVDFEKPLISYGDYND